MVHRITNLLRRQPKSSSYHKPDFVDYDITIFNRRDAKNEAGTLADLATRIGRLGQVAVIDQSIVETKGNPMAVVKPGNFIGLAAKQTQEIPYERRLFRDPYIAHVAFTACRIGELGSGNNDTREFKRSEEEQQNFQNQFVCLVNRADFLDQIKKDKQLTTALLAIYGVVKRRNNGRKSIHILDIEPGDDDKHNEHLERLWSDIKFVVDTYAQLSNASTADLYDIKKQAAVSRQLRKSATALEARLIVDLMKS